ncbi:MAG: histidine triad nucleotide-binding protein [Chloroflexi bacterium]|nr:histidine triad nucleotide-binding protein [Chloroflexota bacterium]
MSCLFCSIANHQIPGDIVYEDDKVIVFRDINPQAPVHVLIIPKNHIVSIADMTDSDLPLVAYIMKIAKLVGEKEGLGEKGYRLVINTGPEGGQVIMHLHVHLLGGRKMPDKMIKTLK